MHGSRGNGYTRIVRYVVVISAMRSTSDAR
jgi:hypothetical protein